MDDRPEISMPFYKVWFAALTSPKETTYLQLVQDPGANFRMALLWLSIIYAIEAPKGIFLILDFFPDVKQLLGGRQNLLVGILVLLLASLIFILLLVFLRVLFFLFWTFLLDKIAILLFRGPGGYDQLVYLATTYSAPSSIIHLCLNFVPIGVILSTLFTGYQIFLTALALKVVNRFSWGRAIGVLLIPLIPFLTIITVIVIFLYNLFDTLFF